MKAISRKQRIVVKIGTSSLIYPDGQVNLHTIDRLAYTLSALCHAGYEMTLVSSGAIGVGMAKLKITQRPAAIANQQALAAIGQSELMSLYTQHFRDYDTQIAQLLVTHDVFDFPMSRLHVLDTINALLARHVIPIVNENDSVATDELDHHTTFGDNDQLSALVATQMDADLLIVLSDIDGLYDHDPNQDVHAKLIPHLTHLTDQILANAGGSGSDYGTGGMVTKLKAAQIMMDAGKQMILASGKDPRILLRLVQGEEIGTHFGSEEGVETR